MIPIRTPEVKAIVSVDGEIVPFVSFMISQEMCQHHDFELLLDHTTFDAAFYNNPDKQLNLIHTKVIIDLFDEGTVPYVFAGIVTNVRMLAREGDHGGVLLIGRSYTVELERGSMCQTFSNTNLMTILREITGGTAYLKSQIIPEWKSDIDFSIQYKEDDWSYLQRILHQYGERYFYSGIELIIGPHPEKPVRKLTYDHELRSFEICSRLLPNESSYYHYRREDHTMLRQDSPSQIEDATSNLQLVSRKSDRLTRQRKPNVPVEAYVPDMGSLIEQVNRKKVATGSQMIYIKGEAKTSDVLIGRRIQIDMPKTAGGADMGIFRVYKVIHSLDETGHYVCHFEAIPADLKYIPTPKVPVPTPNPIECEVLSNEDPLGIGRIKVKFPFDERVCSTWIPTMTPSGGGNGQGLGPVNRGFTMIAEISDSVLVSFLDGSTLSQPVATGSMFHANNSENRGSVNNNIKTIITRSRHMIQFDDKKGNESITIIDKNKNTIFIDTANDNITITAHNNLTLNATETMTLNARDVYINARDNIASTAGKNIQDSAGNNIIQSAYGDIIESSDNRKEVVEEEYSRNAKKSDHFAGEINLISTKEDILVQSVKKVTWNSGEKTNMF